MSRLVLLPIVYVSDLRRSIAFYEALGLHLDHASRSGRWAELRIGATGDAALALHQAAGPPVGRLVMAPGGVELAMVSHEPLEVVAQRLAEAGVPLARGIADEAFGRSLMVRDPDGLVIQVNEHDPDLRV